MFVCKKCDESLDFSNINDIIITSLSITTILLRIQHFFAGCKHSGKGCQRKRK